MMPVIPVIGNNLESSLSDDSAEKLSLGQKQSNNEEEALTKNISRESSRGNFLVQPSTTSNHAEQGT